MAALSQLCIPQAQVCAVRATQLNLNGSVVIGSTSSYVVDSMVTITLKPVFQAGTELKEINGCGSVYFDYLSPPSYVRSDIDFDFLTEDPNFLSIMVPNGAVLTSGGATGFAAPAIGISSGQVGVELWTKRINGGVVDGTFPYAHWLFPYVNNLQSGNRIFSATAGHMLFTGEAVENLNWFDGPENDWPVASNRSWQWLPTATLPAATCTFATVAS